MLVWFTNSVGACRTDLGKDFAHTATLAVLPIITLLLPVISGDIALSLGMRALFQSYLESNRSPLELSTFLAITMGISASVSMSWLIALVLAIVVAFGLLFLGSLVTTNFRNENFFSTSFSEGQDVPTLDVTSKVRVERLERSDYIIAKIKTEENYKYILASNKSANFKNYNEIDAHERSSVLLETLACQQ